jgi:hypothetical protein
MFNTEESKNIVYSNSVLSSAVFTNLKDVLDSYDVAHGEILIADPNGTRWVTVKEIINPSDTDRGCDHAWKLYEGFSNRYEYCEKCDVKK